MKKNNIELSLRLQKIADFVGKNQSVADIGTDHAKLPIFLFYNNSPKTLIVSDINEKPLDTARKNIESFGLENDISLRLGDGLKPYLPNEVDVFVISGVGGLLVKEILSDCMETALSAKKIIIQPQSDLLALRKFLHESGFKIVDEEMLLENKKFYNIILCRKGKEEYNQVFDYMFGKKLISKKSETLKSFLEIKQESLIELKVELENSEQTPNVSEKLNDLKYMLSIVKEVLERLENN